MTPETLSNPFDLAVCSLASGSKGNALYVSDGETSVLLDAGLSVVELERRMKQRGLDPQSLNAIVVSHEHTDHVQSVGALSRRYELPVYINKKTHQAADFKLGKLPEIRYFECGTGFQVNGLSVHPFPISHDTRDPAGFTLHKNGTKIGVATDLGISTALVQTHLKGCALVLLEANHDPGMLMNGPYPWHLKQRIKGRTGHLSNEQTRDLLGEILHEKLRYVILGHLSETNNTPQQALNIVGEAVNGFNICLMAAHQDICGEILRL
jgi:phosphoribosyl 1,2-cyclic phosphodiesterase